MADKLWAMALHRVRGPLALFELAARSEKASPEKARNGRYSVPAIDTAL